MSQCLILASDLGDMTKSFMTIYIETTKTVLYNYPLKTVKPFGNSTIIDENYEYL
jgi:hypothetical protein